jgi:hypothetical protein
MRYAIILATVTILSFVLYSHPVLYAHTFSENEDALFLTMINKIKAQTRLVGSDLSTNIQQAQQHAEGARGLFAQKDPVVNSTWTISKDVLDNPKTQALVLANLGNEIYNNYGNALGLSPSTVANMAGMTANKGSSINTKMSSGNGMSGVSQPSAMNQPSTTIKNLTAYQTAQSLAAVAQQVFDKNLKPIAPPNATNSNSNIANYLNQLTNAVNNKSSFMNVMELIHVKLHPTLISAYNLRLSLPGMNMPLPHQ